MAEGGRRRAYVGPWIVGFSQAVLDAVGLANHVKAHRPGIDGVAVSGLLCELDAVIGQDGVDLMGNGLEHKLQELARGATVSRFNELGDGEPGGPVDAHVEVELPSAVCSSTMSMWKKPIR